MRKARNENPMMPYLVALVVGYIATLVLSAVCAWLLYWLDGAVAGSGAAAIVIMAAACFFAGRLAGALRRVNGLKTGALCGVIYILPLVVLSIIFDVCTGIMLVVKAVLCIAFATAGGVVGVNSEKIIR